MSKVKIHEEAKEVNMNNKEVKEKKKDMPVIIRREVIISDEEMRQRELAEKKRKQEESKRVDIGFVERDKSKDFNIVYRNKPVKPLTASELFGLNKNVKKEATVTETSVDSDKQEDMPENEAPKEDKIEESVDAINEPQTEKPAKLHDTTDNNEEEPRRNNRTNYNNEKRQQYNNNRTNYAGGDRPKYNSDRPGYNNNRPSYGSRDNSGHRPNYSGNDGSGYRPNYGGNDSNGYRPNNRFNNNADNRNYNNRPMDDKRIDKNIKDIMSIEMMGKENVREYANKAIDKQKMNRYDELRGKKPVRNRSSEGYDIDEGKLKDLKQENRLSNMFNDNGGMLDYYDLSNSRTKKNRAKNKEYKAQEESLQKIFKLTEIDIPETITVKDLAAEMKKTSGEVIKKLLGYGIMATLNNELDFDTAFLVAGEFGINATKVVKVTDEEILFDNTDDNEENLISRPPVIVVMGHVDHGKTSLLDAVRSTNVIEGEAGGITQHIGAYKVEVKDREITFLDTPGHEAFTSMRARGAQITDIAILVVAANDGVMPQTIEAINHAKDADIPIIVAINKIDVEGANPEKVKQELTEHGLVAEEWGGETIFVPISAKKRQNIDTLLEMVLLVADMKELKSNPNKQAKGVVIEAKLDKARGPIATMLVQRGTLHAGDSIVVGQAIGRIRDMINDKGQKVKKAGPSTPVEIVGLSEVPVAGETFYNVKDEKTAKHLIERRKREQRAKELSASSAVTLDDLFSKIEQGSLKELKLIVKADVQGSVEAIKQALEKLVNEEVKVRVIHSSVGGVTETDVTLAKVSGAIIIAFNVRPESIAKSVAEKEGIEIKIYSVIYQAIEDVEAAMKGMLAPKYKEVVLGNAEIRQVFKVSSIGTIAGCYVLDGKITRNASTRIIRDNVVIYDGKLASLKRFKDDAKEVAAGYECGVQIEDFNDLVEGDIIEAYIMEEIK